jgi:hypothetical protein
MTELRALEGISARLSARRSRASRMRLRQVLLPGRCKHAQCQRSVLHAARGLERVPDNSFDHQLVVLGMDLPLDGKLERNPRMLARRFLTASRQAAMWIFASAVEHCVDQ